MYIPEINQFTDTEGIVAFMERFSFATIITAKDNFPTATHLPFLVKREKDSIILSSHFAKANGQWKEIENNQVLVIFSEPHAYISPRHYDSEKSVPTWNYIAVHAYGQGKIISAEPDVIELLEQTIDNYDESYKQQWNRLPEDYKLNMSRGIVAFDITVTDLQAKKKLSQNKTGGEQRKIIASLENSDQTHEQLVAHYMQQALRK